MASPPTKEELERAEQLVKLIKDQNAEYKLRGVLNKSHLATLRKAQDEVEKINDARKQESAALLEQIAASEKYYASIQNISKSLDNGLLKNQALAQIEKDKIAYIEEQVKLGRLEQEEAQKALTTVRKQLAALDAKGQRLNNIKTQIAKTSVVNSKFVQTTLQLGTAFKEGGITTGFQYISSLLMGPVLGAIKMVVGAMKQMFFELDKTSSEFMTATGMSREFTMSLEGSARQLQRDATTTLPEYYAATQQMITGVTDFTMASREQQDAMASTATMLERVGVSLQDFGTGAQNSMKMFGMSMNEATSFASELTETAQALGVTPQQMASDYAKVGGSLAKLGKQGPKAFKELARVSKLTGMEIDKLISLTSKFDTFEDAASMTGQLNAALGGNFVNAMDMMMTTDPVARFDMLRDAISSTGLTFDDMSYYQRQFFANAMGLESVGDLALMMSGNMDLMSGATQQSAADYEEMAREAAATADLQRTFNSVLAEMAPMMGEILIKVKDFILGLKENKEVLESVRKTFELMGWVIKAVIDNIDWLKYVFLGLVVAGPILNVLSLATMALAARTQTATLASIQFNVKKMAENKTLQKNTLQQNKNSGAMQKSGKAGGAGAAGLMKFAVAVVALGAGIGIAAAGIGLMALGFKELFTVASPGDVALMAGALTLLALASLTMVVGAVGWGLFAGALLLTAGALALIKTADLEALATFATALSTMDNSNMTELADTLERVAKAMDEIGTAKAIALTATFEAATFAAKAFTGTNLGNESTKRNKSGGGILGRFKGGSSGDTDLGTLTIKFDNDMFEKQVVKLLKTEEGKAYIRAINDEE